MILRSYLFMLRSYFVMFKCVIKGCNHLPIYLNSKIVHRRLVEGLQFILSSRYLIDSPTLKRSNLVAEKWQIAAARNLNKRRRRGMD